MDPWMLQLEFRKHLYFAFLPCPSSEDRTGDISLSPSWAVFQHQAEHDKVLSKFQI